MSDDPNATEFDRLFPKAQFADADVLRSAQDAPGEGFGRGVCASVAVRRITPPNTVALAFATRAGDRVGPFLLTPRVAAEIRKALADLGF